MRKQLGAPLRSLRKGQGKRANSGRCARPTSGGNGSDEIAKRGCAPPTDRPPAMERLDAPLIPPAPSVAIDGIGHPPKTKAPRLRCVVGSDGRERHELEGS